ncbi:MAG: EAL domain-containing protein [Pseudomonadales bacterium]|nr:EAL domain-containing protein [Pseudomonadales bacterium]
MQSIPVNRLQAIFSVFPDVLFLLDEEGCYLEVVTGNEELLYHTKATVLNKTMHEVMPKDKADTFYAAVQEALQSQQLITIEYELEVLAGKRYFEGRITPVDFSVNNKRTVVFLAMDITEKKQVMRHDRLISNVIEAAREGVAIMDDQRKIITTNRAYRQMTGSSEADLLNKAPSYICTDEKESDTLWDTVTEQGRWMGEIVGYRIDGTQYPLWLTLETISDPVEKSVHYAALLTDVSEIKRSREQLEHIATHDVLTGLPNRVLFTDRLKQAMVRAHRNKTLVALFFLDLDRFKVVNDNLGHQMGDELLLQVSQRLTCVQRQEDTLARFGGDEFLVISEGLKRPEDATLIARNIIAVFQAPFVLAEYTLDISTSIGISIFPDDTENAEMLLKNADAAMYQAKNQEGNSYQYCTQDLTANAFKYFSMEISLKQALKSGQFHLVYQPQFDISSGRMIGVEALIRWQHPEQGYIGPDVFIPVAESSGLIKPLGDWIISAACQQIKYWDEQGLPAFPIAINVSRRQLVDHRFCENLRDTLHFYALSGSRIEIEITESAIIDNEEIAYQNLRKLHEMGIYLSIDDFGTGHSSLINLKRFPLDKLKIDRDFVRDLMIDQNDVAIIKATIALARSFNLKVIAEGVETQEQRDYLRDQGCDQVQGYLYSKPVMPDVIEQLWNTPQHGTAPSSCSH